MANCIDCGNEIEQGRLDWAESKGFNVKRCKTCADNKKKVGPPQSFNSAGGYGGVSEEKWNEIADSKIIHNFILAAYEKHGATPQMRVDAAYLFKLQKDICSSLKK